MSGVARALQCKLSDGNEMKKRELIHGIRICLQLQRIKYRNMAIMRLKAGARLTLPCKTETTFSFVCTCSRIADLEKLKDGSK